jgi:BirA family transcriptional regulator, biotin operon repressor / biotin---[acetyl-CoA-carboxylase] ligase
MSFPLSSDIFVEECQGFSGFVTHECTSTMDLAWELSETKHLAEWGWIRAKTQSHGRGQFGREWVSDKGNLMVSLRLPDEAGNLGSFLSLALALCIVRVLESLGVPAGIKWPNDIMLGFEKLGGILIEQRKEKIVAGIGLNISSAPKKSYNENFFQIRAACLKKINIDIDPLKLWGLFLDNIRCDLSDMMVHPEKAVEAVESFLAFKGDIVVLKSTGICDGPARIIGIDTQGRLGVQTSEGVFFIHSGQISLRVV